VPSNEQPAATPQLVEVGERPCERCGKPHNAYKVPDNPRMWGSWADLEDGHAYKPLFWEQMYRREVARNGGRLAVQEHADALRKLAEDD
jgi:hypothetical protein